MTPAIVALQKAKVSYTLHEYAHDAAAESYGMEAAEKLGLDPLKVFKTLVANVDGKLVVGLVPVAMSLDLKALAAAANGKRAVMADVGAAERATGYVAGGISPLGQKKPLTTVIDESALQHERVYVSGGRRGLQICIAPGDLVGMCAARVGGIAR